MERKVIIDEKYVYSRIGMALVSAQRIEFITGQLVLFLAEFDKNIYGLSGKEFWEQSSKAQKARMTLGHIFKLLKLNPKLVIEDELNEYLRKRNILVHEFLMKYLYEKSAKQAHEALEFCNDFGKQSILLERFFRGFLFFLALRHVKDRSELSDTFQTCSDDFDYFITRLVERNNEVV